MKSLRVVVLISGSGTNLQALIDSRSSLSTSLQIPIEIVRVFSSSSLAYGLTRAREAIDGPIPTTVHALKTYLKKNPGKTREDFDLKLAEMIKDEKPDLIVMAGWMLIVSDGFLESLVRDWEGQSESKEGNSGEKDSGKENKGIGRSRIPVINLHPSLPGLLPGTNAIHRAYELFTNPPEGSTRLTKTGIMIHHVIPEIDAGQPIVVEEVEMKEGESENKFEERMHSVEHRLIVEGTRMVLEEIKSKGLP